MMTIREFKTREAARLLSKMSYAFNHRIWNRELGPFTTSDDLTSNETKEEIGTL
jgi:hypothetical protein